MTTVACPKCGAQMNALQSPTVGTVLICPDCGKNMAAATLKSLKLPGLDPGPQHNAVEETEEPIMQRCIKALTMAGYEVLCTVHRHTRHTCSKCGRNEWHSGGYGADPGIPDLLVRRPGWPAGLWLGIETKGTETPLNSAQKVLHEAKAIVVARSEEQALRHMRHAEVDLGLSQDQT